MTLAGRFRQHLSALAPPPGAAIVAVSGGPDSLALLDLLALTREDHALELVVGHADHGIAAESGAVAARVEALAERYSVPFEIERLQLGGGTTETRARAARYVALRRMARRRGARVIVTAHHADDQAETVLMRLLRGSGPAGLAGMRAFAGGILRPLLPFRRDELARYLHERGIEAWRDPANEDSRHLRSWLRRSVLPTIESRLPDVAERIARAGAQAARNADAWDALLGSLPDLEFRVERGAVSVAAPAVAGYDSALAEALVQAAARHAGRPVGPSRARRVAALAGAGRSGGTVPLGTDWIAEVAFGRLYIRRTLEVPEPVRLGGEGAQAWGRWRFFRTRERAPARQPRDGMTAWFTAAPDLARPPVRGDRIAPLGGSGRRLVVRCFQDARIPRLERAGWPLLTAGDSVVWVPGVCRSSSLVPPAGTEAVRIDVTHE
ncbi:MAG TPA: tRNA lysidine(34) synthetase TilS [Gemmatimonadales bacterium]